MAAVLVSANLGPSAFLVFLL